METEQLIVQVFIPLPEDTEEHRLAAHDAMRRELERVGCTPESVVMYPWDLELRRTDDALRMYRTCAGVGTREVLSPRNNQEEAK